MKMNSRIMALFMMAIFILSKPIIGQNTITSKDINIKDDISYQVIPLSNNDIVLYHNRESEQVFEIYDENLEIEKTVRPKHNEENIMPLSLTAMDSTILFFMILFKVTAKYQKW